MKPQTLAWLERVDMDLGMAGAGLEMGFYPPRVFHCQQAAEKALKAVWVERRKDLPARTHNLVDLADELQLGLEGWQDFLLRLSDQAVASRYPSQQAYTQSQAIEYVERTRELCAQLRQMLT